MNLVQRVDYFWSPVSAACEQLLPLANLLMRIYLAKIFFMSGWNKINDWETTLYLFRDEYRVLLLSPDIAALFATGGELLLPVLLLAGLFSRFAACGLFVLNAVAVFAYYATLVKYPAALQDHLEWGLMLLLLLSSHVGRLSVDYYLDKRVRNL